ncbi:hypothetical protein EG832_16230, partial [bacterium]|nr:hypothetical protein [bacterium]
MKASIILSGLLFLNATCSVPVMGKLIHEKAFFKGNYIAEDTSQIRNLLIRSFKLEIVPPSSGVQFYRNGIIFLSYSKADEKVPERHVSFGALKTYTSLIADTLPVNLTPFNLEGQVLFPSEATTFSSDYKTMYLSLIPENSKNEKIFRADLTQEGWKIDPDPIEICSDDQIYSHPCLSPDGKFLIFSSDMSGTKGGLDLFITRLEGDNWTKPQNLGQNINSEGNELFPTLDSRNNLLFSSDGFQGEGGYDVFICRYNGTGWEKPQNLTVINSKDDELAFTINKLES